MASNFRIFAFTFILTGLAVSDVANVHGEPPSAKQHFELKVRPALVENCLECHGATKQEAGLRLDSRAAILKGGESGPAIVEGAPQESLLVDAIHYGSLEMPPKGRLNANVVGDFERWIAAGAPWSSDSSLRAMDKGISEQDKQWWAFRPIVKPPIPNIPNDPWSHNAIDRFVLRRLLERGMQPAPEAPQRTRIRRLYLGLIGLLPTMSELERFLNDRAPDRWERLVDRLLSDPRHGEHFSRFWLDLVRYSDSDGWNQDAFRPHIWRYRDYVLDAFCSDKPFPTFVREQLAGDLLPEDDPQRLAAAGFMRLGIYEYNQRDARGHWNDIVNEMTDVVGDVFFGLSVACARCHDHKFDPLLQRDYFQLRAFFEPVVWRDDLHAATQTEYQTHQQQLAIWAAATKEVQSKIDALLKPYHEKKWKTTVDKFPLDIQSCFHKPLERRNSWEHQMAYLVSRQFVEEGGGPLKAMTKADQQKHQQLQEQLAEFEHLKPAPLPPVMTATDFSGSVAPTTLPGDANRSPVSPAFLTVLSDAGINTRPLTETAQRLQLANWIGHKDNPLTPRVIVNRIWQQHFGRGLVDTSSDFGTQGSLPTHPELLDYLAATFIESGWSFKALHKQIVMSSVWMQSAHHPYAASQQIDDPQEALLWRAPVRRVSAEQIRDAMLQVSGELIPRIGGPSVDENVPQRAIYVKSFRNRTDTLLHAFDVATGLKSVSSRDTTTTPVQALLLINGDYPLERATAFAARLTREFPADREKRVRAAAQLVWGRDLTEIELEAALQFTERGASLVDFCHVLFNSSEFLYIE